MGKPKREAIINFVMFILKFTLNQFQILLRQGEVAYTSPLNHLIVVAMIS
jgi:pilus assembly protein TadC